MNTLTVITVLKDDLKGFLRTINSIKGQSNRDFQYLVLDGSKDNTSSLVREAIADFPNASYQFGEPRGIYEAMNKAVTFTDSSYILFLNAGDVFVSSKTVSDLIAWCNKNSDIDILATTVVYLTPQNLIYSVAVPFIEASKYAIFHHQGVLIKRNLFIELGGFDLRLKYAADGELLDRAIRTGTVLTSNKITVGFDMTGASSLNYWALVNEINSYREPRNFLINRCLRIKNWLRVKLISDVLIPNNLKVPYFRYRHRKLVRNQPTIDFSDTDLLCEG